MLFLLPVPDSLLFFAFFLSFLDYSRISRFDHIEFVSHDRSFHPPSINHDITLHILAIWLITSGRYHINTQL
jgi:hypothetical protein